MVIAYLNCTPKGCVCVFVFVCHHLQLPLNTVMGAEGVESLGAPPGYQEALTRENVMTPLVRTTLSTHNIHI